MSAASKTTRVAIVTGASSGVGLGITRALLERGYQVVANSRTIGTSTELRPSANLVLVDGDIGNKDTAVRVADAAVRRFDRIDLLVVKVAAGEIGEPPKGRSVPAALRRSLPARARSSWSPGTPPARS